MITPADFRVRIHHSISEMQLWEWEHLSGELPFQSIRWYCLGEKVMADCRFFYITLLQNEKPVGRGTFLLIRDEPLPLPPLVRSLLRPAGTPLAVFGMALTMEDVLVRGVYQGIRRLGGVRVGMVEAEWVYNPMPTVPGQIYPPLELKPIVEF